MPTWPKALSLYNDENRTLFFLEPKLVEPLSDGSKPITLVSSCEMWPQKQGSGTCAHAQLHSLGVFAMRVALKGQRRAVLETHVYADLMPEVCISTNPFASSLASRCYNGASKAAQLVKSSWWKVLER